MRLFFAVALPAELVERVRQAQQDLRRAAGDGPGIRWTRPDQFHYTIKFLGEQPPPRAARAAEAAAPLRECRYPFRMTLGGAGAFPSNQRPTTLWLGATSGGADLADLAADLDRRLVAAGFSKESRPLTAHLTLARIKTYDGEKAVARVLKEHQIGEVGEFNVDRLILMRSLLKPSGSEYTVVDEFVFAS